MIEAACLALLLLVSHPAQPVNIDAPARHASGSVPGPDSRQRLECRVHTALGLQAAQCYARDAAGETATCTTQDPDLLATVAAHSRSKLVAFAWDAGGACESIEMGD